MSEEKHRGVIGLQKGETWYGRPGTTYEGVEARIDVVTVRKVSCTYKRIVQIDRMRLAGQVMPIAPWSFHVEMPPLALFGLYFFA